MKHISKLKDYAEFQGWIVKPGSQLRALLRSLPGTPLCLLLSSHTSWRRTVSSPKFWKKELTYRDMGATLLAEIVDQDDILEEGLWGCIHNAVHSSQQSRPGFIMETDDDTSSRQTGVIFLLQAPAWDQMRKTLETLVQTATFFSEQSCEQHLNLQGWKAI